MSTFYIAQFTNGWTVAEQFDEAYLPVHANYTAIETLSVSSDFKETMIKNLSIDTLEQADEICTVNLKEAKCEILKFWDTEHTLFFDTPEAAETAAYHG